MEVFKLTLILFTSIMAWWWIKVWLKSLLNNELLWLIVTKLGVNKLVTMIYIPTQDVLFNQSTAWNYPSLTFKTFKHLQIQCHVFVLHAEWVLPSIIAIHPVSLLMYLHLNASFKGIPPLDLLNATFYFVIAIYKNLVQCHWVVFIIDAPCVFHWFLIMQRNFYKSLFVWRTLGKAVHQL